VLGVRILTCGVRRTIGIIIEAAVTGTEAPMRRAYHFVSLGHGLDDLRQRHLKIARLDEINDPFELWAIAQPTVVSDKPSEIQKRKWRGNVVCCASA
jgi:hypothetical protein